MALVALVLTVTGQELDGEEVDRSTFPLPKLGKHLDQIRDDVYHGRGFAIVRGLDPEEYSVEDLTVVYLGVSSYVAERRGKQDQRGSVLRMWKTFLPLFYAVQADLRYRVPQSMSSSATKPTRCTGKTRFVQHAAVDVPFLALEHRFLL